MKYLVTILFFALCGVSYGQAITGTKTRTPGVWLSSKDTATNRTSADSIQIIANRGDSSLRFYWSVGAPSRKIAFGNDLSLKLNISDTAAMLTGLSLDRVLTNGNSSGNSISVGGVTSSTTTSIAGSFSNNSSSNYALSATQTGTSGIAEFKTAAGRIAYIDRFGNIGTFGNGFLSRKGGANTFGDGASFIMYNFTQGLGRSVQLNTAGGIDFWYYDSLPTFSVKQTFNSDGSVNVTGGYTSTTTSSNVLIATAATTSHKAIDIRNTSGSFFGGIHGSAGNEILNGGFPYTSVFGSISNRSSHWGTNNQVYVTLDSLGRLGVNTLNPSAVLHVNGTSRLVGATTIVGGNGDQITLDNTGQRFTQMYYYNNGSNKATAFWDNTNNYLQILSSNASSTVRVVAGSNGVELANGATSWSAISDERFKTIVKPIDSALFKLKDFRTVIGRYKTDTSTAERSFLIAQDVQKTYPYAVTVANDSLHTLRLSYTELIPLLVKGIQELKTENDSKQLQIDNLRYQLEEIKTILLKNNIK